MTFEEQLLKLATKFVVIFSAIFLVVIREKPGSNAWIETFREGGFFIQTPL